MKFEDTLQREWEAGKDPHDAAARGRDGDAASEAALGVLLESGAEHDAEQRAARLGSQLARLDALNVGGMLAAATEGGGAELAARLDAALAAGAALAARLQRGAALARGAPDAVHARSGAARAERSARALLAELHALFAALDAPPLADLDALQEIPLTSAEGRARALAACEALSSAARAERDMPAHWRRLGGVRERLRRLARARDLLAAGVARHVNNVLVHLANEAAAGGADAGPRAELAPLAPLMRCLRAMDERAARGLATLYCAGRARALERAARAACEAARAALAAAAPADFLPLAARLLDAALAHVDALADAEQDFCTHFFALDLDTKSEGSDSERSAASGGAEARRLQAALFPALEPALLTLTQHIERQHRFGAFVVVACVGRRVVGPAEGGGGGGGAGGGGGRWARAALAGLAVAAKRSADRAVADRVAALPEGVRAAARRSKCGVLPFVAEFEELSGNTERIFAGGRRADLERWYGALAAAMLRAVHLADHPRTPRAVLHLENYHRLHGVLSALRVPALEAVRRECRARYEDALRAYVTQYFGRPLEKLTLFFEGVSEAVALGCREEEVCYRAAFSKHSLRRVLALYPAAEVRRALHRLYRTVEKHLSEEGGLLQVVWRAMQEEFLAQHRALQARIAACYPAAGLALPLTTQDILDAFSDIARDH